MARSTSAPRFFSRAVARPLGAWFNGLARMLIPEDALELLRGGLSLLVASCDTEGNAICTRGVGFRVWADRQHVTVFLPTATASPVSDHLRERPSVACVLSRPHDYLTLQLKGEALAVRPASEDDRGVVSQFVSDFAVLIDGLGVPKSVAERIHHWPCLAVDVAVRELYRQTPGPGAGQSLQGGAP